MTNDNQGVDLTGLREVLDDSITNKISAVMVLMVPLFTLNQRIHGLASPSAH